MYAEFRVPVSVLRATFTTRPFRTGLIERACVSNNLYISFTLLPVKQHTGYIIEFQSSDDSCTELCSPYTSYLTWRYALWPVGSIIRDPTDSIFVWNKLTPGEIYRMKWRLLHVEFFVWNDVYSTLNLSYEVTCIARWIWRCCREWDVLNAVNS